MKTTALTIAAAAIGLAGFAYADEATSPTLLSDTQMDEMVAGKKPGESSNAIEYTKANGDAVYVDEDYNGNVSPNWQEVGPCTYYGGGVCL